MMRNNGRRSDAIPLEERQSQIDFEREDAEEDDAFLLNSGARPVPRKPARWSQSNKRFSNAYAVARTAGLMTAATIVACYFLTAYVLHSHSAFLPATLRNARNILFVTAHPDDECLFFTPAMVSLLKRSNVNAQSHLLVLSAGNNYGLGAVRKQELLGSCRVLNVTECEVLDTPNIQDNPKYWWPESQVLSLVQPYSKNWDIDAIVTFDNGGVSHHINHRAVSSGVRQWSQNSSSISPPVYMLSTVSLLRKYTGLLDLPFSTLSHLPKLIFNPNQDQHGLIVAPVGTYLKAWKAFRSHSTQFSWDRYLYLVFSRYVYVNQLVKVVE